MRHSGIAGLIALAVVAAVGWFSDGRPLNAHGTGIDVNSTADLPDVAPWDGVCADGSGLCTLRAAVQEANAQLGPNEIHLPAGTYTLALAGQDENEAATGDLDFADATAIIGPGAATTIIDGGGLDRVLHHTVFPTSVVAPEVSVSGVTIRNGGGGLSSGGAIYNVGSMRLTNVIIEDNAADFFGGGIQNDGALTIELSTVGPGNGADYGGGIFNFGELSIADSTIDGNDGGNQGGGLYNFGTSTISGSTFSGNAAVADGGGIVNDGGAMSIVNSTISGNEAGQRGGGIANGSVTPGFRLPSRGVGPIAHGIPAALSALNVTIADNSAATGGNLLHVDLSTATLQNTLIALATAGSDCAGAPIISAGHNLDTDGTCGLAGPGDTITTEAHILPLADNGGATRTHALIGSVCGGDACNVPSQAIDAADIASCPATDQRGEPRPFDGNENGLDECDVGAYELQQGPIGECTSGCPPSPPSPSPSPAPSATPAASPAAALPAAFPNTGARAEADDGVAAIAAIVPLMVLVIAAGSLMRRQR
jgi:CSLREA domain-containing protein